MSAIAFAARSSDWRFVRPASGLSSETWFFGDLEQGEVLALFQSRQILDLLAGRLQYVNIQELLVSQIGLGFVLENGADRGFEVLVGER